MKSQRKLYQRIKNCRRVASENVIHNLTRKFQDITVRVVHTLIESGDALFNS